MIHKINRILGGGDWGGFDRRWDFNGRRWDLGRGLGRVSRGAGPERGRRGTESLRFIRRFRGQIYADLREFKPAMAGIRLPCSNHDAIYIAL